MGWYYSNQRGQDDAGKGRESHGSSIGVQGRQKRGWEDRGKVEKLKSERKLVKAMVVKLNEGLRDADKGRGRYESRKECIEGKDEARKTGKVRKVKDRKK